MTPTLLGCRPGGARKRRRQDSGVHLDDEFEGCAVNKDDSSGKDGGRSVTELSYFQHLSGILAKKNIASLEYRVEPLIAVAPASNI